MYLQYKGDFMGKTKKRYNGFIVAIALLVLLSSLLFIGLLNTTTTASAYAMQLENVYQKAFSELYRSRFKQNIS